MCEYCEKDSILMQTEVTYTIWGNEVVGYKDLGVIYDTRGYLRLVDLDDYDCLDHGELIKVNYCFNCGRKLDWEYEVKKCSCYELGESLNSGLKCSNCGREL